MTEHQLTRVFDGHDNVFTMTGPNGKDEGLDFLLGLERRVQVRFEKFLAMLRDGVQVRSPENMRFLSSDDPSHNGAQVHELKVHHGPGFRLYVIRWQGKWYVTHGARKPKDNQVKKQITRAFAIFNSHS